MSRYDRYGSRHRYDRFSYFPPSKSKDERIVDAAKKQQALEKKGQRLAPVVLQGFAIASTFWGKAWCKNIESYHDYSNRLPRGRSYVRSNSVIDLQITPGVVQAQVMGSSLYRIQIRIKPVSGARWQAICSACAGKIGSLIELLQGRISNEVMSVMTQPGEGLFPQPGEISFTCSCPDVAGMCKHIAAVMYGIGNRLDTQPELLFLLRGTDSADLISAVGEAPAATAFPPAAEALVAEELSDVFGVEIETAAPTAPATPETKQQSLQGSAKTTKRMAPRTEAPPPVLTRKRGRPKKIATDQPSSVASAPPSPTAVGKPRGRPKKADALPPLVKRPRGRPRKMPTP